MLNFLERMLKNTLAGWLFFIGLSLHAQVVINEMDTDTPGTDDKEFIELKSVSPNFALDPYVLVFYNGSGTSSTGNRSYYAIDLDGFTTDANGIFVVGNQLVSPVPDKIMPNSVMQNGEDAIALYLGSAADFPNNTYVTNSNLVDAIVYDTDDPDATTLMSILGVAEQINENMNGLGTTQSIQRKPDGTYEVKAPTPGANNDGSGFVYNGISIGVTSNEWNEGDSFVITFTTQTPVTSTLNFSFSLANGQLQAEDFSGNLNISIPAGGQSATTTIQIIDDTLSEVDELGYIRFGALPFGYKRLNDNIEIRVIDNDFTTLPWGTPLNPTYGQVSSTQPSGYYDSLEGKAGAELRQAIQDIIANPAVVRAQNYGDVQAMLNEADQSPLNSNQVWLMYVEYQRSKYKFQSTSSNVGSWNREHIFPQSRGGFADGTSSIPDGINTWLPSSANDILAGHADGHHIRAEDGPENTRRSNKDYGLNDYVGPLAGTQGSWRGDVARSLFYMACRYNGLEVVNGNLPDSTVGQMGDLATLLSWNHSDPSDDFEMNRNNVIYTWQMNRNPFIDHPDLADYVWGSHLGEAWHASLSRATSVFQSVLVYPNPAHGYVNISGLAQGRVSLYSTAGALLQIFEITNNARLELPMASGLYLLKLEDAQGHTESRKLLVQ